MSDQGIEEKDLGAQDSTVSAGDKPADTRIAPGVTEQDHTENKAGDVSVAQPKKRQLTSRTIGAIAACAIALVAVLAGVGYATGLFGSAQSSEQVTHQQAQEQSASVTSSSAKQPSSGQSENSQDGGDKASSEEDGKAKDENSSTDSSQQKTDDSSTEQASHSDASSGSAASNASENSGPASSSGSAPAYQEPEPEPAPAPAPSTISVYISIDSSRAQSYGLGGFSYGSTVVLPQGSTVYDALCATGASISGSSYYVSAINGLAEKQCGNGSGWTYAVNGSFPGKACGRYTLSGGESISWIYSTEKNPTMAM